MVDVSWSVASTCGSSFLLNMETTTFFSWVRDMKFFLKKLSTGGCFSTVCGTHASLTSLGTRGNCKMTSNTFHFEFGVKIMQTTFSFLSACFFPCLFGVLRGTQRTLTGRPTAGARVLAMVSLVLWHPYHSGPALHCRVPSRPERC